MDLVLGVDLGSTTCKAVLLDLEGRRLGRGLASTGGHYGMAIAAATEDALTEAGLALAVERGLLEAGRMPEHFAAARLAECRHRYAALRERLIEQAGMEGNGRARHLVERLAEAVEARLSGAGAAVELGLGRAFGELVTDLYLAACEVLDPLAKDRVLRLLDPSLAQVERGLAPLPARERLRGIVPGAPEDLASRILARVGTGYGRQLLPFPEEDIRSEILCHARGIHRLFPGTRTLLDIGGQDTKAIQLDAEGLVTGFSMNDRCAAGCGRYLGYLAEELGVGIADLGALACSACRQTPVTSTCTVLASAELRGLLHAGERAEEVLLGAHRAILLRAFSLLARCGGVRDEFAMTGGVAMNPAIAHLLHELMPRHYPGVRINLHPDSIHVGAYGAALFALERL